jgi:tripartite-type tricarboxylate transporter receptor subunit TctC
MNKSGGVKLSINKWMRMGITATILASVLAGCGKQPSTSQANGKKTDYPKKQIEMIVPFAAGGGTDAVARALASTAGKYLPQPIGVVNKTGGAGAVGMNEGAKAKADGYTITMVTVDMCILANNGLASFKTDDFKPVALINEDPAAITVKADAPWNTLEEFIKYAKENPNKVRVGNGGKGGIFHLSAEAFGEKTGITFSHIPFEGAAPAVTSLLGGNIEAVSVSPAEVGAQVQAGKLKMLGIMSNQRVEKFKDVPTLKEKGIDLVMGTWRGITVPKDTPQDVVNVLSDSIQKATQDQAYTDVLNKMGLGIVYLDEKAFGTKIQSESTYFKGLIDKLGLKN